MRRFKPPGQAVIFAAHAVSGFDARANKRAIFL